MVLPALSVKLPAATSTVTAPSDVGVRVTVYVVPDPEKLLRAAFETLMSSTAKSVVGSESVNVSVSVSSFDAPPSDTAADPAAVMVIVGAVLS